jgi:hypothetical protein
VTIIAGFKSHEGIVICADTQETIESSKKQISKLRFEPADLSTGTINDLAVAFCGSGDGPYVDKLIQNAWENLQTATSLDEVSAEIEKSIKNTYREFGRIYQTGLCPSAELIYGVKMFNGTKLFSAYGPIVNEIKEFHSSGIGHYIADFLASRMYKSYLGIKQCVILAAYILFQAKEHVEGCGGQSQIAVLRDDGTSGVVEWRHVEAITELLQVADDEVGRILLDVADLELDEEQIREHLNQIVDSLMPWRDARKEKLEKSLDWDLLFSKDSKPPKRDSLGLLEPGID